MTDKNLIFLISQPRSGSTLTQKIIGTHSKVYTRSEPWIMLNQLSQFKQDGSYEKYDKPLENTGVTDFFSELPNGKQDYLDSLNNMYLSLYDKYLQKEDKQYFLDKTPRYYLIIDELIEVFPDAKFILLKRNPLAVLSSIINTWHGDDWYQLSKHRADLIDAVDNMIEASNKHNESLHIFFYENLLKEQTVTLKTIFKYIGIDFEEKVFNYNQNKSEKWRFGDPKNVYEKSGIDSTNDLKWTKGLDDLRYWRVMHDYLQYLGKEKFEQYGYNYDENLEILKQNMPCKTLTELENQTTSLFVFWDYEQNKEALFNQKIQILTKTMKIKNSELEQKNKVIIEKQNIEKQLDEKTKLINKQEKELKQRQSKINALLDNRWYRFGQMSRKKKIWTIGKTTSKKIKLYWLLQPIAKLIKR